MEGPILFGQLCRRLLLGVLGNVAGASRKPGSDLRESVAGLCAVSARHLVASAQAGRREAIRTCATGRVSEADFRGLLGRKCHGVGRQVGQRAGVLGAACFSSSPSPGHESAPSAGGGRSGYFAAAACVAVSRPQPRPGLANLRGDVGSVPLTANFWISRLPVSVALKSWLVLTTPVRTTRVAFTTPPPTAAGACATACATVTSEPG